MTCLELPSNTPDNVYCTIISQSFGHGAMTGLHTSGLVNRRENNLYGLCFVHINEHC